MRQSPLLLRATVLLAGLSCAPKEVICHGPSCTTLDTGVIHRSVGPGNTAALAVGDTNPMRLTGGVATFDSALPDRVGVGDAVVITVGETTSLTFVSRRWSGTEYELQTTDGGVLPDNSEPNTHWSIYRAYTSLIDAIAGDSNAGLPAALAGFDNPNQDQDLVAAGKIFEIACYGDAVDSADTRDVLISPRWKTSREYYLRIFAPSSPSEAGTSQRHAGVYDPSRYEIRKTANRDNGYSGIIFSQVKFVRVEGLQITDQATNSLGVAFRVGAVEGGEVRLSGNLLIASSSNAQKTNGIVLDGSDVSTLVAFNNVVAGFTGTGMYDNTSTPNDGTMVRLYNNTFYGCPKGINTGHARIVAVNDLFGAIPTTGACVDPNTPLDPASDYNVCPLAAEVMTGAHSTAGTSATWVNPGGNDFHLSPSDTAAIGKGADLSTDTVFPFTVDYEEAVRSGAWDVGADQH